MNAPSPRRVLLIAAVATGLAVTTLAPGSNAAAPSHKTVGTSVSDGTNSSTTSLPITAGPLPSLLSFTVANTSTGPQAVPYGSFQLRVPAGISVTGALLATGSPANFNAPAVNTATTPNTITITSNGPTGSGIAGGSALTVFVAGSANAGVCPGTWAVEVKQSNDFSGTGNDFSGNNVNTPVAGGTQLVWTTQPVDTQYNADMFPSPQVTLEDGCGNAISAFTGNVTITDAAQVLSAAGTPPTRTEAASGGTATINHLQFTDYGLSDTLIATVGAVTATSQSFTIYQLRKVCGSSQCPSGTLNGKGGTTTGNVVADGATTADVLTVNVKGTTAGTCGGTTTEPPLGELVTVDVSNRGKTLTMTLLKDYVNAIPNNGTPFMDLCLDVGATGPAFYDKRYYANPTLYPGTVTIGLIADCTVTGNVRPCVVSRKKNAGNEVITANLPPGDPKTGWF